MVMLTLVLYHSIFNPYWVSPVVSCVPGLSSSVILGMAVRAASSPRLTNASILRESKSRERRAMIRERLLAIAGCRCKAYSKSSLERANRSALIATSKVEVDGPPASNAISPTGVPGPRVVGTCCQAPALDIARTCPVTTRAFYCDLSRIIDEDEPGCDWCCVLYNSNVVATRPSRVSRSRGRRCWR